MLMSILATFPSDRIILSAWAIFSSSAPPPTSRKLAGRGAGSEGHVHRRHREAGAVDHTPYIAVQPDVADAEFTGLGFERVFLFGVVQLGEVRMSEHRVGVEG